MSRYGLYDPENTENSSMFFIYQEVPVTSAKLNRWNGNLAAEFELFHRICSAVFSQGKPAVIAISDSAALQVIPANPPNMTVQVLPGWAVLENSVAGIGEAEILPSGGTFVAPQTHPRIDLVVVLPSGEPDVVTGTESVSPVPPIAPDGALTLAHIHLRPGATAILTSDNGTQAYIQDVRPKILLGEAHRHATDLFPPETPDGSRHQFSTTSVFREGTLDVYLNGVLQKRDVDYSESADRRGYSFSAAPLSHYRIQHRYLVEFEIT